MLDSPPGLAVAVVFASFPFNAAVHPEVHPGVEPEVQPGVQPEVHPGVHPEVRRCPLIGLERLAGRLLETVRRA